MFRRLFTLFSAREHTLLLHAGDDDGGPLEATASAPVRAAHGLLDVYVIAAPETDVSGLRAARRGGHPALN